MSTITDKKQYPSEQYLNELVTNMEFAARAPVEVVRAMAAELQKRREADSAEPASNHEELPLDYLQGQKMVLNGLRSLQKQITHKLATGFTMTRWSWLKLSEKVMTCQNSMDQLR